jgi:hypothetical protein
MAKELDSYEKLVEGFILIGESLQEINAAEDNKPIDLLISKLISKMGFSNADALDELSMIRFAVAEKDYSLEKLTAQVMGKGKKKDEPKAN